MWFKARHVAAILSGEKTDTIRALDTRCPKVGAIVPASVGPVRAFAYLCIVAVEEINAADLSPDRLTEVASLIGEQSRYRRIVFAVHQRSHTERA